MKWVRRILFSLIAAGLLAVAYIAFRPAPVLVDLATVDRGPLRVTVDDDGRTRIRESFIISAPLAGRLQRIDWDPGDPVKADHTELASIEPPAPELLDARSREEAEARLAATGAAVSRAQSALERTDTELTIAANDASRIRQLYERGAASKQESDDADLIERVRLQEKRTVEFGLEVARFEKRLAEAALRHSKAAGDPAQPRENLTITSPVTGRVLRVFQESTTIVTPGTPLIEVGDPTDIELVVDVLSTDAVLVQPGAEVIVERWGGDKPLTGIVRTVEPAGFTKISALGVEEQRVNVIIDLVDPPDARPTLGDGFRVEVRIVVWEGDDVLHVPTAALFRSDDAWMVYAVEQGKAVRKPVEIGRQNGEQAEVLGGLGEGDTVVLHPGDQVSQGATVQDRQAAAVDQ